MRACETREVVSEKTLLLRKIARVFEEELDDREQALEALINALEEDFHDRETARYLEKIAQATGKWLQVIERVNGWLKAQTDPAQKIRLCLHLAKWYGEDLGHPEYAQPYYAQIVQLDPNNVGALRQMAQLYRGARNWQQLGATLTRALDVAVTDLDRKEILTELGEAPRRSDQPDRPGRHLLPARARGRWQASCQPSRTWSASTPRGLSPATWPTSSRARSPRSPTPPRSRARSFVSRRSRVQPRRADAGRPGVSRGAR